MNPDLLFGLKVKILHTLIDKEFNKILQRFNITPAQGDILQFLESKKGGRVSQRDIERHLNLSNPTVTGTLQRIEAKGLVSASANALDRRSKDISLTEKAEEHSRGIEQAILNMERKVLAGLSPEETQLLHGLLSKIINNIKEIKS